MTPPAPEAPQYQQQNYQQNYQQPGYPQQGYQQPQYSYNGKPQNDPGKSFAIASLVLGILSFFCAGYIAGTLAVVFGFVARNKGYRGGMATAGMICGALGVVLMLVLQIAGAALQFA